MFNINAIYDVFFKVTSIDIYLFVKVFIICFTNEIVCWFVNLSKRMKKISQNAVCKT